MNSDIPSCNTLAFFDLETSGLPAFQNKTRVTELCFWAVEKSQFLETKPKEVPRVMNRLSLCIYPSRLVDPVATEKTGLDNYNLEHQAPFNDETANIVLSFLNRLKRPVCLIAHNGDNFDFPLLKAEIEKLGKELPSHILCCDSLPIFQELDRDSKIESLAMSETSISAEDIQETSRGVEITFGSLTAVTLNGTSRQDNGKTEYINPFQLLNERTPVKRRGGHEQGASPDAQDTKRSKNSLGSPTRTSYRLEAIYRRALNQAPESAHHAEGDVKMLLLAAASFSSRFLQKIDANAKLFTSVKKLW